MVSFVFNGGALWSVLLLALRKRRFNIDPAMMAMTIAIYAYCAANLVASIVNHAIAMDALHLIPLVTFLFFPISYSTCSITGQATLVRIIVLSSAAACLGALILAFVSYFWRGMRATARAASAKVSATSPVLSTIV